jgi:hypothetical protein
MITPVTFVITASCQRYSLTDDRDHDARHSGDTSKQDPAGPDLEAS